MLVLKEATVHEHLARFCGSTGIHVVGSYAPGTGLRRFGQAENAQPVPGA